jgi:aminoglycoside 6'-N-acetyltransferase
LESADGPLVRRWLEAEHVRRWWGDPEANARILSEAPGRARHAVIVADGLPVGLVLSQQPSRKELDTAGLTDVPETVVDLDVMVGEEGATGRGVGCEAIRLAAEAALADPSVPFVTAAVHLHNARSLRAFAKAGFEKDREFDDPGAGRHALLVRRRRDPPGR